MAVAHPTDPASPLCLYHERYLRRLLARGEGVFWQWAAGENGRIWLYRPERVAAAILLFSPAPLLSGHLPRHAKTGYRAGNRCRRHAMPRLQRQQFPLDAPGGRLKPQLAGLLR
jgi:hypothetical protein